MLFRFFSSIQRVFVFSPSFFLGGSPSFNQYFFSSFGCCFPPIPGCCRLPCEVRKLALAASSVQRAGCHLQTVIPPSLPPKKSKPADPVSIARMGWGVKRTPLSVNEGSSKMRTVLSLEAQKSMGLLSWSMTPQRASTEEHPSFAASSGYVYWSCKSGVWAEEDVLRPQTLTLPSSEVESKYCSEERSLVTGPVWP